MVYRRELAVHVSWRRDTIGDVRVIGAREAIPIALRHEQIPEDLASDAPDLAFDPGNDRVRYARGDSGEVRHPLAPGSEARSEEHTSELQSQSNLVCRLLLEKKREYSLHAVSPEHSQQLLRWPVPSRGGGTAGRHAWDAHRSALPDSRRPHQRPRRPIFPRPF